MELILIGNMLRMRELVPICVRGIRTSPPSNIIMSLKQQTGNQQRQIVGKTIKALRDAFDNDPALSDKWILYTPRYNAFFPTSGSTYGNIALNTDGEGIDVLAGLDSVDDLDYVHFMMYDLDARSAFSGATEAYFVQDHYDKVIQSSIDAGVPTSKLIMGFEPGVQA